VTPAYSPSIAAEYSRSKASIARTRHWSLPATPSGRHYFLLLVDDATRCMWVVLLTAKSEASSAIKRIQAAAEKECGRKLRVLRTDNGGEFTAAEFAAYCADEGISHTFRHHTPCNRTGWWSGEIRL
jgi:transposase InsO family protein